MTRHIGIVACSAEGAALCYRTICTEAPALLGGYAHPEISLHGFSFEAYMDAIDAADWATVAELMLASAGILKRAGADFAMCPDNTVHEAFDAVDAASPLPWLHIGREVAQAAVQRGHGRPAVLGTRYLMEGPVYPTAMAAQGLECLIPEAQEREIVNRIIFDELVRGQIRDASRRQLLEIIERMQVRGADSVVLGCTELPLIITPDQSALPVLDSTRILARAALREAVDSLT